MSENVIRRALCLHKEASAANKAVATFNYGAGIPLILWLMQHASEEFSFKISFGAVGIMVLFLFALLEVARRSAPRKPKRAANDEAEDEKHAA